MVSVGTAATEAELYALLKRADPSVIVLDVFHPGMDGLALSLRLKRRSPAPRIVLYSGRGGQLLTRRLAGTSLADIASTLRLPVATITDRTAGIALALAQARA